MAEQNKELLLTPEERIIARDKGYKSFEKDMMRQPLGDCIIDEYLKAQLAKAKPIIGKTFRKKIDRLQEKLVTTNVYYLKEIQEVKKQERERIIKLLEGWHLGGWDSERLQALKGE